MASFRGSYAFGMMILCVLFGGNLRAREVIRTIPEIRALSPEESEKGLEVKIEATTVLYNVSNGDLVINDGNVGDFVLTPTLPQGMTSLRPGDRLLVEGKTFFGAFIPSIKSAKLTLLERGPVPAPRRVTPEELFSPSLTLSWVEIPAVIVGTDSGGPFFALVAEIEGWTWRVMLPANADDQKRATQLMQRTVLIRGVVGTIVNSQGQMTGRLLYVQSFDEITPTDTLEGVPSNLAPLMPVDHLLRSDTKLHSLVRVQGIVTYAHGDNIYLRGQGGSLLARAAAADNFIIGDSIEVEGFAAVAPFRPILRAFRAVKLATNPEPLPLKLDFGASALPSLQNELVTVEATILGQTNLGDRRILQCKSNANFFEAHIPSSVRIPFELPPGTKIRLTGICELDPELKDLTLESVARTRLNLRRASDIEIIAAAPWWTIQRLLWVLGILAAIAAGAFFWVVILRRRVRAQTELISQRIQKEATLEERQRVARELHDTIEQQLAGLSIQLGSTRRRLTQGQETDSSLELALSMLRHCREEIHTSVRDLRSVALEQRGLPGAIEELLAPALKESGIAFRMEVKGTPKAIGEVAETHLLRIAQEAVANAHRHSGATEISVSLDYSPDDVLLEIKDNGSGFECNAPAPRGHFGLLGIRERANKLGATPSIKSSDSGTVIQVKVTMDKLGNTPDRSL